MTYATTFSGIGGWELGLNACGWELLWQCECDPFCQALLRERFGVPIYPDIRTICEQNPAPVDALIGSPPCQPYSVAGKKSGAADERHLYPAFIRVVSKVRPRWVLMEQSTGIFHIPGAFAGYLGGLVTLGYNCLWHCIPACAVGAPHERDRLWIVAYSDSIGRQRCRENITEAKQQRRQTTKGFYPINFWSQVSAPMPYGVANGISDRVDRIKGAGNAVIPQIPYLIAQSLTQIEG